MKIFRADIDLAAEEDLYILAEGWFEALGVALARFNEEEISGIHLLGEVTNPFRRPPEPAP